MRTGSTRCGGSNSWPTRPGSRRDAAEPLAVQATQWPALGTLAGDLAQQLEVLEDQNDLASYALDVAPQLDRLSLAYIAHALRELGWQAAPGESFTRGRDQA